MPRKILLATVTVTASTLLALIIGELFLVVYSDRQSGNEKMDPGLVRFHTRYGWTVTPGWRGIHEHAEYKVTYRIDPRGFRQTPGSTPAPRLSLVVGDSFTFGLGVEDETTFVSRLAETEKEHGFVNAAVPGYSPEQVLLRTEDLISRLNPDRVLFFVYLGNDLVDLGLPYPVQAEYAKPYAYLDEDSWKLMKVPPGSPAKPDALKAETLGSHIMQPGIRAWLAATRIGSMISEAGVPIAAINHSQVERSLALMSGILQRLEKNADRGIYLVLLPGSGPVNRPGSLSARYQLEIATGIERLADNLGMRTVSLVQPLQQAGGDLYYRLDGHLTSDGHRVVASILQSALAE